MKALLSLLVLCSACAFGQRRVDVDNVTMQSGAFFQTVNGTPVHTNVYYRVVDGSAFFKEEWLKGSAALSKEQEYQNLMLKLNLLENQLHFRDAKGNEMISNTPINRVTLMDSITGKPYHFINSSFVPALSELKPGIWVEALAEGRAQLYVQHKKTLSESRPYGSATLEQRILTIDLFYLVVNNNLVRIKKVQDIVDALPDKKKEVQQWARSNQVEKNQQGFARLVEYYNSLGN